MAAPCCDKALVSQVVDVAREWIGTPYVHQASCKLVGTDCLGLVRGIWREVFGAECEEPGSYSPDWAEASASEPLLDGLARHLERVTPEAAAAGDILVFRMLERGTAKHLAILTSDNLDAENATMIHAYSGLSVCETRLSHPWHRRIAAVFRMPVVPENWRP